MKAEAKSHVDISVDEINDADSRPVDHCGNGHVDPATVNLDPVSPSSTQETSFEVANSLRASGPGWSFNSEQQQSFLLSVCIYEDS